MSYFTSSNTEGYNEDDLRALNAGLDGLIADLQKDNLLPTEDFEGWRKHIAEKVCTAKASRAAGAAIGRNPISLLIPCHRVLATNGAITGYHWGLTRKRAMLALEAALDDIAKASGR